MILGFFSFLFDLLFLNFFPYLIGSSLFFPMFTLLYIVSRIYFNKDIKYTLIIVILIMSVYGYFFYIVFSLCFFYLVFNDNKYFKKYFFSMLFYLLFYDFFLVLLNNINIMFYLYKLIITIPINIFYSFFLYRVLNNKKYNIK